MTRRETAVIDRLEPRICLKCKPILHRSRNILKARQRNHIELKNLSCNSKIAQLARIAAGNIKGLIHGYRVQGTAHQTDVQFDRLIPVLDNFFTLVNFCNLFLL